MSFYRWCMRHGAGILFVVALAVLIIGLLGPVLMFLKTTGRMASDLGYVPDRSPLQLELQLQMVASALGAAAWPFFGALLINRLDRRAVHRDDTEPFE